MIKYIQSEWTRKNALKIKKKRETGEWTEDKEERVGDSERLAFL
jgi:hypothetical protein